jgi:hypothetical protein
MEAFFILNVELGNWEKSVSSKCLQLFDFSQFPNSPFHFKMSLKPQSWFHTHKSCLHWDFEK